MYLVLADPKEKNYLVNPDKMIESICKGDLAQNHSPGIFFFLYYKKKYRIFALN